MTTLIGALVWQKRRTYAGFGRCILGNLSGTLCLIALSLRGSAPDWFSILFANAFALAASILFFQGIRMLRGLRLYWWPEYLASLLAIAAVTYYRYNTNNLTARAEVMSLTLGAFGLCTGFTLLARMPARRRFSMILTGSTFILGGAFNFFRLYLYWTKPSSDLFAPSGPNAAFFAASALGIIGWSFGFFLMTEEQLSAGSIASAAGIGVTNGHAAPSAQPSSKPVSEADVRVQLQRIVESDVFRKSARMERFLIVAVERTLMGRPEELKEYSIGRDVFSRGENYDPRTDSIVRVEAQRLRRKLREYYASQGVNDPVILEVFPGSYVPQFRYREMPSSVFSATNR